MIRLFDNIILQLDGALDTSKRAVLLSDKVSHSTFLETTFNISKLIEFEHKSSSFVHLLSSSFEDSPRKFWSNLMEGAKGGELFIYVDELSFNQLVVSFLGSAYPRLTAEDLFIAYNLLVDRVFYLGSLPVEEDLRKPFGLFKELYDSLPHEPFAGEDFAHMSVEFLLGNHLANSSKASRALLEAPLRQMAKEFLWTQKFREFDRQFFYGFYEMDGIFPDGDFDLSRPSVAETINRNPALKPYCTPAWKSRRPVMPADFDVHAKDPTREKIAASMVSFLEPWKKLAAACEEMDIEKIVAADLGFGLWPPLFVDTDFYWRNNCLMVSYLYACRRRQRNDLLKKFELGA